MAITATLNKYKLAKDHLQVKMREQELGKVAVPEEVGRLQMEGRKVSLE